MVYIRVLGSFTAERDGETVPLGGHRQRSALALLVAARGRVVSVDRMVEELWQDAPPARAVTSLQAYVSNLRRLLEPGRPPRAPAQLLVSAPPGYALRLPADAVDAWRFEQLLRDARELLTADPDTARGLLREALALWQGPAYADTADEPWTEAETGRLDELRLTARELDIAAALRGTDRTDVVAEAGLLTRDQPLREEGWRLHALALWATGRQADALAVLRRARAVLAEEAGIDPGPALTELEAAVLAQDDRLLLAATDAPPFRPAPVQPPEAEQLTDQSGPFVGREHELALLAQASGRALADGPAIALVTGEAGLGKSALLNRLGDRLGREGWLVAVGRTTVEEGAPPAWAWVEALRTMAATAPPGPAEAAVLAPLLADGPAGNGTQDSGDAALGRFRLHRAVWQWLAEAARERPVAVVLDDLHWADAETLALLAAGADLPSGARVLLVCAYRPEEVGSRLGKALAVLARSEPVRVVLGGLPESAVAEVVRALGGPEPDRETLAALTERTGGNPFYVRESARLLSSEGALVALSEVPEGVRDVLRRRLGRLPEVAVAVLLLAAGAGRESRVEVLVEAAETDEDGVLGALEAGLLAGLLVEPAPGLVRFAHALVRDTLLADLSGLRSARMHGRIAATLERLGSSDVSVLAHHFVRAASSATAARAVRHCVRAAELAGNRYAHEAAAAVLTEAVACFELVPAEAGSDREAERVELQGRLLRAQVRAGAVTAARATHRAAIDRAVAVGRDDLLIRVFTAWTEATPWQSRPYGTVDRPVVALLERLLGRTDLQPAVRCRLLGAYVAELSDSGDPGVSAAAREAVALAADLGDPALRAATLVTLARELDTDLDWREQADLGRELDQIGAELDLPGHQWHGRSFQVTSAAASGETAEVRRLIDECAELATSYRMPGPGAVTATMTATLAHLDGRIEASEAEYTRAAALMAGQGSPHAEGYLVVAIATLRATEGRLAELLPQARRLFEEFGPLLADLLAVTLAAAGEQAEARRVLAQAGPVRPDYFFKVFATFRAMAMVMTGETGGAAELYEALLPYRDAPPPAAGFTVAIRPVAETLGELAALLGREAEARAHFARAAEIAGQWRSADELSVP
ncbi:hypothetical protein GCM10009664_33670 [Kitasatospora gansuensis]